MLGHAHWSRLCSRSSGVPKTQSASVGSLCIAASLCYVPSLCSVATLSAKAAGSAACGLAVSVRMRLYLFAVLRVFTARVVNHRSSRRLYLRGYSPFEADLCPTIVAKRGIRDGRNCFRRGVDGGHDAASVSVERESFVGSRLLERVMWSPCVTKAEGMHPGRLRRTTSP